MSVDDLLSSALEGRGGGLLGTNLFALAGDPNTSEMFVLNLQDFFTENLRNFLKGENAGAFLLGAYYKEDDARKSIDSIRDEGLLAPGLVYDDNWHVLLWKVETHELYTMTLLDYYVGFLELFRYKSAWKIVILNIFTTKQAAEDTIEFLHLYVKDENGNIIS